MKESAKGDNTTSKEEQKRGGRSRQRVFIKQWNRALGRGWSLKGIADDRRSQSRAKWGITLISQLAAWIETKANKSRAVSLENLRDSREVRHQRRNNQRHSMDEGTELKAGIAIPNKSKSAAKTSNKQSDPQMATAKAKIGGANISGSRFAVLEEVMQRGTTGEDMDEDQISEADPSKDIINEKDLRVKGKDKRAQTLTEDGKRKEGITVSVSHMNLTENLKTGGNMGLAERIRVVGPNGESKKKVKVLTDVTNKLEARPHDV